LGMPGRIVRAKAKIARTAMSLRTMADYANAFGEADAIPWRVSLNLGLLCYRSRKIQTDPLPVPWRPWRF